LCDTWVDTTEEEDYMEFANEMIVAHKDYLEKARLKAAAKRALMMASALFAYSVFLFWKLDLFMCTCMQHHRTLRMV
jgi:hypothetical protein